MSKKLIVVINLLFVSALLAVPCHSTAGKIQFEVTVRERPSSESDKPILVEKRQFSIEEGVKTTAFIVNFTLDLTATRGDSGEIVCDMALYTLPPQTETIFKKFASLPGGVYFIDNLSAKNGATYRVGISPLTYDRSAGNSGPCDYDYRREGTWNFDPSAHCDFYFVPGSLGDARWNRLRDFVEEGYRGFKRRFGFSYPGKVNYFFAPCLLPQLIWDGRMGYALDPSRNNCFALYSATHNTVDPIPGFLATIYRNLGYAPPVLAEGLAAYFDIPHYYARELRRNDALPPITQLFKSLDYFALPRQNNISAASSFVKYLIDTHDFPRFEQLYRAATDLNLKENIETIYGQPLAAIEKAWHEHLDTLTIPFAAYQYSYQREAVLQREHGMNLFLEEMRRTMSSYQDSLFVLNESAFTKYVRGDFDSAQWYYRAAIGKAPNSGSNLLTYGNLLLADGLYDSARVIFRRALTVDSTMKSAWYKLGESFYWQGLTDSAEYYITLDFTQNPSQLSRAASAIVLGEYALMRSDTVAATGYYTKALAAMQQLMAAIKTEPAFLLRLGQARMGLAICGKDSLAGARSDLEKALFFEVHPTRTIYLTRILFELGRVADLQGRRDEATAYYRQALQLPMAVDLKRALEKYLQKPFIGFSFN